MNVLTKCFFSIFLILVAAPANAEVVIKQKPLTWSDVSGMDGQEMYGQLCASCHGLQGKGDGPAAPALDRSVPNLTLLGTGDMRQLTHAQLENIIAGRSRTAHQSIVGMPLWELEFQYIRPKWNGQPRVTYARAQIHKLADYVDDLNLVASN